MFTRKDSARFRKVSFDPDIQFSWGTKNLDARADVENANEL